MVRASPARPAAVASQPAARSAMPCTSSTAGPAPRSKQASGTPAPSTLAMGASLRGMEGFGGMFGDPEEMQRRVAEFAEQLQGQQQLAWADNAIKLAVELTVAAVNQVDLEGNVEQQAEQIRSVMAIVFPEAVTLVREARQGLQ